MALLVCLAACAGPKGGGDDSRGGADDDSREPGETGDSGLDWPAGATVLDHAVVIDARGAREGAAVVLVGDEIWSVTDAGADWPDDAVVVDLEGASVVPGLIDAHVHLFHSGSTYWVGDTLADNLAAQLRWGVLAVADLGSPEEVFALRDRVASGELLGPRIWATGPFLTAVGSHPCETQYDEALCRFVEGDGADQVAALAGSDGLKVALADADFTAWGTPRLDLGDLADITAASDKLVLAHIDEPDDAADALASGVDVLAHPVFSEILATTPDAPTHSTLGAFAGTGDLFDGSLFEDDLDATPAPVREAWAWLAAHPEVFAEGWIEGSEDWEAAARANIATAITLGHTVVAGSDAGYYFVPHGLGLHRELGWLVEAGMSPLEALAAATTAPAAMFGWSDLGLVDAGYRADLLVVAGRPDDDIDELREIQAIYLGGQALEITDLLVSANAGAPEDFCLDDRDCAAGACDLVDHVCAESCAPTYDRVGSCDGETWCMPADAFTATDGVCHPGDDCDLYDQDCAPSYYGANCAPIDLDTNTCWPSGPQGVGEDCSWTDADLYCAQGLFCSWLSYRCYELCDPTDPDACPSCVQQTIEGEPWFGLCL